MISSYSIFFLWLPTVWALISPTPSEFRLSSIPVQRSAHADGVAYTSYKLLAVKPYECPAGQRYQTFLVAAEGNVSGRKRRIAHLVPLRQQSPMVLLYAIVAERCSHPCSPLASKPPARPLSAQTGNPPYSRTVVNKVGFVDHYPINDSFRTLQYHVLPKISIARCPKRSTFLSDNSRV